MFDCSGGETEFHYDYSGGITDERLSNLSSIFNRIDSFLHGGVYLNTGDAILFFVFVCVLFLFFVVIR